MAFTQLHPELAGRAAPRRCVAAVLLLGALAVGSVGRAAERVQTFDADPNWEGRNNRSQVWKPREVRQDFGYSATHHAGGGAPGEIGGFVTPTGEPAYYARKIAPRTFNQPLTASGVLNCTGRHFNVLVGFFNVGTLNEWRTPNTVALRLYGRGDVFYAYVEYMTQRWRAGADSPQPFPTVKDPETGRDTFQGFASGVPHKWTLTYDPAANDGAGAVTATIDGITAVCHLSPGHKADGAAFNRFGLLNVVKHADTGGEVWIDDVSINGESESFTADPGWEAFQNRRAYVTDSVRPRFDFGFSPTHYAGGRGPGELGGVVFRGDNRTADKLAYYADRIETLRLDKPLEASGKISLRRGVSDSTTLLGFFHSRQSTAVSDSQRSGIPHHFIGLAVEGPSSEGFFCYPTMNLGGGDRSATGSDRPHILPDGSVHDWTFRYEPLPGGGGRATVSLDGKSVSHDLPPEERGGGAQFDRFGIVTTWIDGNGQNIYFDDLRYTWKQE